MGTGLKVFHDLCIVHRDIKPANLLLTDKTENAKLKICDLGLSKNTSSESCGKTKCGTRYYMAPEILQGRRQYSYKVDLWSAGVILYEMIYGERPFNGHSEFLVMQSVQAGLDFT